MSDIVVLPSSFDECKKFALAEAKANWTSYLSNGRDEDLVLINIFLGKMTELVFSFLNKPFVDVGVSLLSNHPDDGSDLTLKNVGRVLMKSTVSKDYVNDHLGIKKDRFPTVDDVLLVFGFIDATKKKSFDDFVDLFASPSLFSFYCQAPSKLIWHDSRFSGVYLHRNDMIKWTNDTEMHERLGHFPKKIWPDDDV